MERSFRRCGNKTGVVQDLDDTTGEEEVDLRGDGETGGVGAIESGENSFSLHTYSQS